VLPRCAAALLVALALAALTPGSVSAQDPVFGYLPEESPYRDVSSPHELSLESGYLITAHDRAGVNSNSAPIIGIRELVHLGGPAIWTIRLAHSFSDRNVIDPSAPVSLRQVGTQNAGLTILDTDFGINITGDRSWRYLMPYFTLGPGIVSDLGAAHDAGGYRFGTAFTVTYGGGFRWVPASRFSMHVDAGAYLWSYHYPGSYHNLTNDGTTVIPTAQHLTAWRNNLRLTIGASYAIKH